MVERSNLFLDYIMTMFKKVKIIVKSKSDFRNLPLLVQLIQHQAPHWKIQLELWQLT